MSAAVLVIFLVGSVFYIRNKIRGKVYAFVLAANKQLNGHLLKPHSFCITIGHGEKEVKFLTHPSKQFWSYWPPGFPRIIQEPIPTYLYSEGNAEPIDPFDRKALISPESLMKISDDAMLKQTWKDVRETLGVKTPLGAKLTPILVLVTIIAILAALYFAFRNGVIPY